MPLNEYQNPELYDAEYGQYTDDFEVFLNGKTSGTALDLACGTGRLTIAMAKAGLHCIGLDITDAMLTMARTKSQGLTVKYINGDICSFNLQQKFDLITMAGNSFQALLTTQAQEKMLYCLKTHMDKTSIFIFNTRNPNAEDLRTTNEFEFWHNFTNFDGGIVQVLGRQSYDSITQLMHYETKRILSNETTFTNITLKFTSADEILRLLNKIGFQVIKMFGDFKQTPFNEDSKNIIIVCSLKN
jgi:2-polyprenyl-3-methyl-5-hydroxy-6-metoxy-1,4-benzoquinol methylase